MPTLVFQGLQSCTEPQMVETTLRLKLSSPDPESNCWDFIQTLANISQTPTQVEPSYVHPMTKNSSYSKLGIRSLELCTENLGCETGTSMIEGKFFSLATRESNGGENNERTQFRPRQSLDSRKKNIRNFPPPLTTMSGSNCMQVRPIREGGRLVIEAIEAPSSHGCFQAERNNGRLRLSLSKDLENDESSPENEICENEIEDLENGENYEEIEEEDFEEDIVDRDMEGNIMEVGGEMGIGKFQRLARCNEGGRCNKSLCTWELFWVATS